MSARSQSVSGEVSYEDLQALDAEAVRAVFRSGSYHGHTANLGTGRLQANLAILPEVYAIDFFRYCQRNPKPCPLVGVSDTGDPMMSTLGEDIDIRTDLPGYCVYRNGRLDAEATDVRDLWREDFVAFALGCSFTFERALREHGVALRHITENKTVAMYKTNIETIKAGPFGGGMVVSMRPIRDEQLEEVVSLSRTFPQAHGAPVHIGTPAEIGIDDLVKPDWGDAPRLEAGETPVFWACGVTPQNALNLAKPSICITHKPGRMLITDVPEDAEVTVLA